MEKLTNKSESKREVGAAMEVSHDSDYCTHAKTLDLQNASVADSNKWLSGNSDGCNLQEIRPGSFSKNGISLKTEDSFLPVVERGKSQVKHEKNSEDGHLQASIRINALECGGDKRMSESFQQASRNTRRKWSFEEERKLVEALKDLVSKGTYKIKNKFKAGYLTALEAALKDTCSNSGLKAKPHIESRVKFLKKDWNFIHDMITSTQHNNNGFRFNYKLNIICAPDEVWNAYVKRFSKAEKWRCKGFPYYKDCCFIFGRDGVNENNAMEPTKLEKEINNTMEPTGIEKKINNAMEPIVMEKERNNAVEPIEMEKEINNAMEPIEMEKEIQATFILEEVDDMVETKLGDEDICISVASNICDEGANTKKRRREEDSLDNVLVNRMIKASQILEAKIKYASDIIHTCSDSEKRGKIMGELNKLPFANNVDKFRVCAKLARSLEIFDVFLSLNEDMRFQMATMILDGSIDGPIKVVW